MLLDLGLLVSPNIPASKGESVFAIISTITKFLWAMKTDISKIEREVAIVAVAMRKLDIIGALGLWMVIKAPEALAFNTSIEGWVG